MHSVEFVEDMMIVITTEANFDKARKLTQILLKNKLVVCVSIKEIESHYWWKEEIEVTTEFQLLMKTKKSLIDQVSLHISKYHSYSVPEIIYWPVSANNSYMSWAEEIFSRAID